MRKSKRALVENYLSQVRLILFIASGGLFIRSFIDFLRRQTTTSQTRHQTHLNHNHQQLDQRETQQQHFIYQQVLNPPPPPSPPNFPTFGPSGSLTQVYLPRHLENKKTKAVHSILSYKSYTFLLILEWPSFPPYLFPPPLRCCFCSSSSKKTTFASTELSAQKY